MALVLADRVSVATWVGTQTNIFNIIGALGPSVGDAKFYPPHTDAPGCPNRL